MPVFPVQEDYLKAVKERVNLARELDQLELQIRKGNSEEGWLQKAAKDMDIVVDDLYPLTHFFIYVQHFFLKLIKCIYTIKYFVNLIFRKLVILSSLSMNMGRLDRCIF